MVYCTLFDSHYMDKGIVMINSLLRADPQAQIHVLCMDDKCRTVLADYYRDAPDGVVPIALSDFADGELTELQKQRSRAEFCWTCTARLIRFVLERIDGDACTYIDSDLYFYQNPAVLIEEMRQKQCTVQVVPHNFPPDARRQRREETIGKNCVEFNTFTKESRSLALLDTWIRQTTEECSVTTGGDQKYTDAWGDLPYVSISQNLGAGIAPWNVERFRQRDGRLYDRFDKQSFDLVFYHFQNVINHERHRVTIEPLFHCRTIDKKLVLALYMPYLRELELAKRELESRYGILPLVQKYVASSSGADGAGKVSSFLKMPFSRKKAVLENRLLRFTRKKIGVVDTSRF